MIRMRFVAVEVVMTAFGEMGYQGSRQRKIWSRVGSQKGQRWTGVYVSVWRAVNKENIVVEAGKTYRILDTGVSGHESVSSIHRS